MTITLDHWLDDPILLCAGRRLSQDGPPRIANGPEVTFGEWQECGERTAGGNGMHTGALRDGSSSNSSSSRSSEDLMSSSRTVMYQNLRSGDYEFRVSTGSVRARRREISCWGMGTELSRCPVGFMGPGEFSERQSGLQMSAEDRACWLLHRLVVPTAQGGRLL
eukprot:1148468-Pelagomonas_calceolata.AAC.2